MTTPVPPSSIVPVTPEAPTDAHAELRQVAQELEASFLAEMLKHAGFGEARGAFGGGAGEDQFASLLRAEHAQTMAANGGIGLAESIFDSLVARHGTDPETGAGQ